MLPIPAINLKDGKCVRLQQGRMEEITIFSNNPVEMAAYWIEQGASRLHLVDLNGALAGSPQNADVVRAIAKQFPDIPLQIGGGIRDEDTARHYWDLGVKQCIISSKAVSDPEYVIALANRYPKKIILSLDAKDGFVAVEGWAEISNIKATDLARKFSTAEIKAIIYTDICRNGTLEGVNLQQTCELAAATDFPVIAAGGISSLADIAALRDARPIIFGAILERAIYDGIFSLQEAYATAGIPI